MIVRAVIFWNIFTGLLCIVSGFLISGLSFQTVRYENKAIFVSRVDNMMDVTPNKDGGVLKRVIRRGKGSNGYPLKLDTVVVGWKFFLSNGTLAHSSETLKEPFDFFIGAEPRQVILAWEYAVKFMFEGEIAELIIKPEYGFGSKGAPPMIPSNATITCHLELKEIIPSVKRQFKTVGENESLSDELLSDLQSPVSPIAKSIIDNKPIAERKSDKDRKYFDPAKHKVDPRQRVVGKNENWVWDETPLSIEVEVKLPESVTSKDDLDVNLSITDCSVRLKSTGAKIIAGPWQGKIRASESSWAYLPANSESVSWYDGPRLLLSLTKAISNQDIWASVIADETVPEQDKSPE